MQSQLTPQQAALELIARRNMRHKMSPFVQRVFHTVNPGTEYLNNWHVDLISEYLEACYRRQVTRLIINIPPRMLKSTLVSVAWPAWLLGQDPTLKVLASSYAHKLALKHNTECRLVLRQPWYQRVFPQVQLADDQDTKDLFVTTARGQRFATSVGGTATGEGGDFLIVDDPVNPLQAASQTMREAANNWFDHTFSTRLNDKKNGVIVVVMQRLHAADLSGHLLHKGGWEHLCLPAVAPERTFIQFGDVSITREEGEPLHAEREGIADIERAKRELGSMAFAGQYQQRPAPAEGGIIKLDWLQHTYARREEQYTSIVQSWDTAVKADQIHDPSCCITFGMKQDGHDVLDVTVARMEYPDLKRKVMSHAQAWGADAVLIEDKASGQSLLQDLRRETALPLIAIEPRGDKVTRIVGCSAIIEAGKVRLPEHAHWLEAFISELLLFPNAIHDDQVDALSQYLNWVKGRTSFDVY